MDFGSNDAAVALILGLVDLDIAEVFDDILRTGSPRMAACYKQLRGPGAPTQRGFEEAFTEV